MAVGATGELLAVATQFGGGRILQGGATVAGDGSGGNATLDIGFPRVNDLIYKFVDFYITGEGGTTIEIQYGGHYTLIRGSSWIDSISSIVLTAGGRMSADDRAKVLAAQPYLFADPENGAAGFPRVRISPANTNAITYRLFMTVWEIWPPRLPTQEVQERPNWPV